MTALLLLYHLTVSPELRLPSLQQNQTYSQAAPKAPAGWSMQTMDEGWTLRAPTKSGEIFSHTITKVVPFNGTDRQALDGLWAAVSDGRKRSEIVTDTLIVSGWRGSIEQATLSDAQTKLFCEIIAFRKENRLFSSLIFADSKPTYLKYKGEALQVFREMTAGGDPVAIKTKSAAQRLSDVTTSAIKISDGADPSITLPPALSACGFAIRDSSGKVVLPAAEPRLGVTLEQSEVQTYARMYRKGLSFDMAGFLSGYDRIGARLGCKWNTANEVKLWMSSGVLNAQPVGGPAAEFVYRLSRKHDPKRPEYLDPIQLLVVSSILKRDIAIPFLRGQRRNPQTSLLASIEPGQGTPIFDDGAIEDLKASIFTTLASELKDRVSENVLDSHLHIKYGGEINTVLTITKFISFWNAVKIDIQPTGQVPLIRRKDTSAGGTVGVRANVRLDANDVQNTLKDNRLMIVTLTGIDVDQVKTQPLAGVETEWSLANINALAGNDQIMFSQSQTGGRKEVTDANGMVALTVSGVARKKSIDDTVHVPVDVLAPITVTTQLKRDNPGQDFVDGFIPGFLWGRKPAAEAFINLVAEFAYRTKVFAQSTYQLPVRDWSDATARGELSASFDVQDSQVGPAGVEVDGYRFIRLRHKLELSNIRMQTEALRSLPPAVLKDIQSAPDTAAGYKLYRDWLAKNPNGYAVITFTGNSEIVPVLTIDDEDSSKIPVGGCMALGEFAFHERTTSAKGPLNFFKPSAPNGGTFRIELNVRTNKADLTYNGNIPAQFKTVDGEQDRYKRTAQENSQTSPIGFFDGVRVQKQSNSFKDIPVEYIPGQGFQGKVLVPFTYGVEGKKSGSTTLAFRVKYAAK